MWSAVGREEKCMVGRLTLCYETYTLQKKKSHPSLDARRIEAQIVMLFSVVILWV